MWVFLIFIFRNDPWINFWKQMTSAEQQSKTSIRTIPFWFHHFSCFVKLWKLLQLKRNLDTVVPPFSGPPKCDLPPFPTKFVFPESSPLYNPTIYSPQNATPPVLRFRPPSRADFATFTRFKLSILSYFPVKFRQRCLNCSEKKDDSVKLIVIHLPSSPFEKPEVDIRKRIPVVRHILPFRHKCRRNDYSIIDRHMLRTQERESNQLIDAICRQDIYPNKKIIGCSSGRKDWVSLVLSWIYTCISICEGYDLIVIFCLLYIKII